MCGGIDTAGEWAFAFGAMESFRVFTLTKGCCWLSVDGVNDPIRLAQGDCVLMPFGRPFRLASDLSLEPIDAMKMIIKQPLNGRVISWNGGGEVIGISAMFAFASEHAKLLSALPPVMHLRNLQEQDVLSWCMQRMMHELSDVRPGGFLLGQHLSHIMLLEALRQHLSQADEGSVGWLVAIGDRNLCAVITAIHQDSSRNWTLQELAAQPGMSRTRFAARFKELSGTTPMEYMTRWRMLQAAGCGTTDTFTRLYIGDCSIRWV